MQMPILNVFKKQKKILSESNSNHSIVKLFLKTSEENLRERELKLENLQMIVTVAL